MPRRSKHKSENPNIKEMFGLNFAKTQRILKKKPILHVTISGKIEVENCNGILQYTSTNICLDMGELFTDIKGDNLLINTMQKERIVITGRVFSVVFRFEKEVNTGE